MPKSTFDTHLAAIKAGTVTKTNVTGMRKALNTDARRSAGRSVGRTATTVTDKQFAAMFAGLQKHKPVVAGKLHDSGLKHIQNKRYRRQLESVADLLPNVTRFRLVDFAPFGKWGEYFVPVYLAETNDGRGFRFVNVPWQSGGRGPEVI